MSPPLTYLQFHLLFVLPPIALVLALTFRREGVWWGRGPLSGLAVILVLAVTYTTPWDNLLIAEGVWWYGEGTTLFTVWYAPIEEYLFFVLQPILTALVLFQFPEVRERSLRIGGRTRAIGVLAGLAVGGVGLVLLANTPTFYMGAILVWAGPILAIQWGFGWPYLWAVRRSVALAIALPTLYLWAIDRIAIGLGIWVISDTHTVGLSLLGLPVEEALFFLVTNVFVVQGIVLYLWTLERWEPDVSRSVDLVRAGVTGLWP
ncbi:lycopene cyclase domain-containing protein [Natronorarus salvus]|uniref:lycopene cyclase domain-containing protein n=1 Tax=Natronorarus salvus TaxID=3117733 RepID=UPI002F263972